jgi:hypothetical protein
MPTFKITVGSNKIKKINLCAKIKLVHFEINRSNIFIYLPKPTKPNQIKPTTITIGIGSYIYNYELVRIEYLVLLPTLYD